ncbi:hypothetical protein SH203_00574 [Brevundimonas sp. SH203]|uniref:GIN domain-containing protein n=1 Tax=Brevundimonas sp. SH203 TaxID=345167 RepID=UPI0009D022F3|nr:DUF2807 domain-containing protein [Brevundimonas sp. SH203]GAW40180.1 hypothetical protein SH203_00574 [Brevundimonas sp. SH203]
MKTALIAAATAAALTGMAAAPASAAEVQIRNAVARVVVIVEDRQDVGVEVTQGGSRLPAVQVRRVGRDVRIDGGLGRNGAFWANGGNRIRGCNASQADPAHPGRGATVEVGDIGRLRMEDAPMIVIRTPRDVDVSAGGAVFGSVGRGARSVELNSGGCGAWNVANVDGRVSLGVGGSGSIRAGSSRALEANVGGSGSIYAGPTGNLKAAVGGSGNVEVASAGGEGDLSIGGSGGVNVRQGRMDKLTVAIGGSGDVRYGGATRDLSVAIAGSGNVRVASATGAVSRTVVGSGTLQIGR